MEREIKYFKNYFSDFLATLNKNEIKKLKYVLDMLISQNRISKKFVDYIRDGLYELRINSGGNIYRIFFIFDDGNIIVLFNGFQKKTKTTPESEINKALKIKNEYYEQK